MARDYEDIHDLDNLSDRELRDLVREHLAANNTIDVDEITVTAKDGQVTLDGRVGTEQERLVAEHVVTDVIGAERCQNNIFVDETRRALSPEAMDEHLVEDDRHEGLLLGDRPLPMSPEAESVQDDSDHELYGTTDVGHAIADGTAWIPPESPTPEGFSSESGESGEAH